MTANFSGTQVHSASNPMRQARGHQQPQKAAGRSSGKPQACTHNFLLGQRSMSGVVMVVGILAVFAVDSISDSATMQLRGFLMEFAVLAPILAGLYLAQLGMMRRRLQGASNEGANVAASWVATRPAAKVAVAARPGGSRDGTAGREMVYAPQTVLATLRPPPPPAPAHQNPLPSLTLGQQRQSAQLAQAVKAGDLDGAEDLVNALERGGMVIGTVSYSLLIQACVWRDDLERGWRLLDRLQDRAFGGSAAPFNAVMDACGKKGMPLAADKVMMKMIDFGVRPNVISFSTVIYAHARLGRVEQAEGWLRKMKEVGISPNVVTYDALIISCVETGDFDRIDAWVMEMEEAGIEATVTTYTTVMDVCAKAGDVKRAEEWYARMVRRGVEPNVVSYTVLIDACTKTGDVTTANLWYQRLLKAGIRPNTHTFNALIKVHCGAGTWERGVQCGDLAGAERWLDVMEEKRVVPVVHNFNTLIQAYSRGNDHESALRMLNRMEAGNVQGDAKIWGAVMSVCARANRADLAEDVFKRMLAAGIEPSMVSISMLARAFSRQRNWQACEALMQDARERGMKINSHMLTAMLLAYAFANPRQPLRAEALIREAKRDGVEMTEAVITAMQKAVGRGSVQRLISE